MALEVGYREVELLLTRMSDLPSGERGRMQSRIKRLQRLGVPAFVNTGKGHPARYGAQQILQLAVALELLHVGMTAEAAASLMKGQSEVLADAVLMSGDCAEDKGAFLLLDPVPLPSGRFLFVALTAEQVCETLRRLQNRPVARTCLINVTTLITAAVRWFVDITLDAPAPYLVQLSARPSDFVADLKSWAAETGGAADVD